MKTHSLIAAIVLLSSPAFAQESAKPSPTEMPQLQQDYIASLKRLREQYVKDNNIAGAAAVSQELDKLTATVSDVAPDTSPVGRWQWAGGGTTTTITADAIATNAGNKGVWRWTEEANHKLQIQWQNGQVDSLTVAPDGKTMRGINNFDEKFIARRLSAGANFATWEQGQPPLRLIRASEGFCALTGVSGHFQGGGEGVRVYVGDDGYWYIGGKSMQQGVRGECVIVPYPKK